MYKSSKNRGGSSTSTLEGGAVGDIIGCPRGSPEKFSRSYVQICTFDIKPTYNH